MNALTHYVVVRRDLPFGDTCAQIAHAAGESFYAFACRRSSEKEHLLDKQEVAGSSPAGGSHFDPSRTVAVVLGARNEGRLLRLAAQLRADGVAHVVIREPDGEYAGQIMAIGLEPAVKSAVGEFVREFHMMRQASGDEQRIGEELV